MPQNKISIVGLGWLGLPLYYKLKELGYLCVGSTTSIAKKKLLQEQQINAFQLVLNEEDILGEVEQCLQNLDILILNTPPGLRRNPNSNYVAKIQKLLQYIEASDIQKIIYVSSTSVFKDMENFPVVNNNTFPNSETNAGIQIRKVEELLQENKNFQTTILRFSGLVDERRHPATMMSKRAKVLNPNAPINLIHREDCIGLIVKIIEQEEWGKVFNASYPKHIAKQEYYNNKCIELGLEEPNFDITIPSKGKLIDGNETASLLKYTYKYVV